MKVSFGEPMDFSEFKEQSKDPVVLRNITNSVMRALQELSGQEYVDIYATKARELLAEEASDEDRAANAEQIADAEEE